MVVPFAAGASSDILARILAPAISENLGKPVIIENVGGAGGMTGAARVAKGQPDGYQVLLGSTGTLAINQTLYKNPSYNAATDFAAIALLAEQPIVLVARNDMPVSNLKEFIAYVRENQDKLQFASAGAGTTPHLGCLMMHAMIGVKVTHIPYRGLGLAIQDMIAGQTHYQCAVLSPALPQIQGGLIKPIAMLTKSARNGPAGRPHGARAGAHRFRRGGTWHALVTTKGTPTADRQPTQRSGRRGNDLGRGARANAGARRRSRRGRAAHASISAEIYRNRDRQMGAPDQGRRSDPGVTVTVGRELKPDRHRWRAVTTVKRRYVIVAKTQGEQQCSSPIVAAFAALLALSGAASAQDWPTRPVTMVVAYAAGGPVDTIARIFAQRLSEILGQQVVIENIGGAGGMIGAARVAKAAPDGYTFLFGGLANLAQNQTLYKEPLYNAATDFTPVGLVTDSPRVLITRKDFPTNTFAEFQAYAKANQAKMQYGSAGGGSGGHVCTILLDTAMGTKITHVPYRGAGPRCRT